MKIIVRDNDAREHEIDLGRYGFVRFFVAGERAWRNSISVKEGETPAHLEVNGDHALLIIPHVSNEFSIKLR